MAVNFKLLRTDTADKRPTAAQLSIGELGLNYDATTPGLFFEDDAGGVRKIGPMEVGSSAPNASPAGSSGNSTGELWLDNSTGHVLKYYTGSAWTAITNTGDAGSDTQVIFNDGGSYAGDSTFTFNKTSNVLTVEEVQGRLCGPITFEAKAASVLARGDVLFVSSVDSGVPVVKKADADDATKVPAIGLCDTVASSIGDTVHVIVSGYIENIDTDTVGYNLNDELFLDTTVGGLTTTPPTGESAVVQHIGTVVKVDSSAGIINVNVSGVDRNPNLNNGNIFIGNGSNQAITDAFTDVLNDQAGISSSASATALTIDSSQNLTLAGSLSFSTANDILIQDNSATALEVKEGTNAYMTFVTTDGSEKVSFSKTMACDATGNSLTVADTLRIAQNGSGLRMTNVGAFDNDGSDGFRVYATNSLYLRANGENGGGLVIDSTDQNVKVDNDLIQTPSAAITPANNGELVVEATSNTTLTFKLKGSDGTVRSGTITLS